jgi:hypothetical protein
VFSHPEALVSDVDDHRTVHEPVEDRSRDRGIAEQLPPACQGPVGGNDRRLADLVAAVDDLEESVGLGFRERRQ